MSNDTDTPFVEQNGQKPKFDPFNLEVHSDDELQFFREIKVNGTNKEKRLAKKKLNSCIMWNNFIHEISTYKNYKEIFAYNKQCDGVIYKGAILFYTSKTDGKFYKYVETTRLEEPTMRIYKQVNQVINKYEKDIVDAKREHNRIKSKISGSNSKPSGMMTFGIYGPPSKKYNNPRSVEYVIMNDIGYCIFLEDSDHNIFKNLLIENNLESLYNSEKEKHNKNKNKNVRFSTRSYRKSNIPVPSSESAKKMLSMIKEDTNNLPEKQEKPEKIVNTTKTEQEQKITFPYTITDESGNHVTITYTKNPLIKNKYYKIHQVMIDISNNKRSRLSFCESKFEDIVKHAKILLTTHRAVKNGLRHTYNSKPETKIVETVPVVTKSVENNNTSIKFIIDVIDNNQTLVSFGNIVIKIYKRSHRKGSNVPYYVASYKLKTNPTTYDITGHDYVKVLGKVKNVITNNENNIENIIFRRKPTKVNVRNKNKVESGSTNISSAQVSEQKNIPLPEKNGQMALSLAENTTKLSLVENTTSENMVVVASIPQKLEEVAEIAQDVPSVDVTNHTQVDVTASIPVNYTKEEIEDTQLDTMVETAPEEKNNNSTVFDSMAKIANRILFFVTKL